ncbi:hypothetical protein [[Mycoplasma] imitans]|uniref:hypothetical protein n=1 Tax=[Mycoplasma] imitans TaxID=29560 RepID=UPI0004846202|nr:hypothetical protein [[Mycoplasma] imitans]
MFKFQHEDIDSKINELKKELEKNKKPSKILPLIKVDLWRFISAIIFSLSLLILSLLIFIGALYPKQFDSTNGGVIGLFWIYQPNNDPLIGTHMRTSASLRLTSYGISCIIFFLINMVSVLFYYGYSFKDQNYLSLEKKPRVIFNYKAFGYSFFILISGIIFILGLVMTDFTQFPDASKQINVGQSFGYAFKITKELPNNVYELGIDLFGYLLIVLFFILNLASIYTFFKLNTKLTLNLFKKKRPNH